MRHISHTLKELAQMTGSELHGDPHYVISGVETLENATETDASFLSNPRYREVMTNSKAGVICIDQSITPLPNRNFLISANPSACFQQLIGIFVPYSELSTAFKGIHPTAVIHPTAKIGKEVTIGPFATIDAEAVIGDGTLIYAYAYIGTQSLIGEQCLIYSHVVIRERCVIGNRVILQPGAVIGSCGFGYLTDASGKHQKLKQLGNVVIEDDVEIGANTTIDRARFKETRIGKGSKIDNLVQIGHNVQIGEDNIIVSQTGIAGSTKTGKLVIIGGQAGIVGHIEIASGSVIAARGGVSKSIERRGKYAGSPVMSIAEHNRQQVLLRNIDVYVKEIEELKTRLAALEEVRAKG